MTRSADSNACLHVSGWLLLATGQTGSNRLGS